MFEKIKELVSSLDENLDLTKYKNSKETRKTLQEIKKEAQFLRKEVLDIFKKK